jgi:Nif-specific regulatory protein
MTNVVDEQVVERDVVECLTLEEIATVLVGPGSSRQKINRALDLLRRRLRSLRGLSESEGVRQEAEPVSWQLAPALQVQQSPVGLVGRSVAMRQVVEAIHRVSHSSATVLLRGESGTGKELVARAIHLAGPRAQKSFVPLHCAAVSEALLESELFGHERGAFTGALDTRKGRFELADGGTLFLDEIGDIPLATQIKLLRVLQEKCFERVGGVRPLSVDVRVIAATHRDLEAMVRAGAFREDLYYRLNVVPIGLPPLRARTGDVPLLIEHFLARLNRENHRAVRLSPDLLTLMEHYHWPGNVRELQNCMQRLVVMADPAHERVAWDTIPGSLRAYFADMKHVTEAEPRWGGNEHGESEKSQPLRTSLVEIEREQLLEALQRTGWVQAKAGRLLGFTPRQVAYKMKKYGISEMGQR